MSEYVGDMTFKAWNETGENTDEDWAQRGVDSGRLSRAALSFLNKDDRELAAWFDEQAADPDFCGDIFDLVEAMTHEANRLEAGVKVFKGACARIIVVAERYIGEEQVGRHG